jgi:hypothetical protein
MIGDVRLGKKIWHKNCCNKLSDYWHTSNHTVLINKRRFLRHDTHNDERKDSKNGYNNQLKTGETK